jgi:hypothetical protein
MGNDESPRQMDLLKIDVRCHRPASEAGVCVLT